MAVNTGLPGQNCVKSGFRGEQIAAFTLTLNGATTSWDSRGNRFVSAVAQAATGEYTITLKDRWAEILPLNVDVITDSELEGKCIGITDGGAAANVVTIQVHTTSTGADTDPAGASVVVALLLSQHKEAI